MVMVTKRTLIKRIAKAWENCTDQDKVYGAQWYLDAQISALEIAKDCVMDLETVVAVIAHLSPRVHWKRNVLAARLVCSGIKPSGIMSGPLSRAITAMASNDPIATINGNKTAAFAQNILGNHEAVTIDTWILKALNLEENDLKKVGNYALISDAFRQFAHRTGIDPASLQAAIWINTRKRKD